MSTETEPEVVKAVPVVLPIAHWVALKKEARETGRSASAIVRELVAVHLLARSHHHVTPRKTREISK